MAKARIIWRFIGGRRVPMRAKTSSKINLNLLTDESKQTIDMTQKLRKKRITEPTKLSSVVKALGGKSHVGFRQRENAMLLRSLKGGNKKASQQVSEIIKMKRAGASKAKPKRKTQKERILNRILDLQRLPKKDARFGKRKK